jgi:hypothetical protein
MNVIELLDRLNGEVLSNKARAVIDGKIVILARMVGADWEYTPEGQLLADAHSNQVVAERTNAPTKSRKVKDMVVSSTVAVESTDTESEM